MNDHAVGLVLKQGDYRENAVLATVLSQEYGKISLVAAGARKMTSRNAGAILPYTKGDYQIDYREGRSMFRLKSAGVIAAYRTLHEDLLLSSTAAVMAEIADAVSLPDTDPAASNILFTLLDTGFQLIDQKKDPQLALAIFLAEVLKWMGIGPDVDECVLCGRKNAAAISAADGGFLCADCAARQAIPFVSVTDLRRFRILVRAGYQQFEAAEKAGGATADDIAILMAFLRLHGGVQIRSFAFYQRVLGIESDY